MSAWDDFREGFENGLRSTSGPDGSTNGPRSCLEAVIWLIFLIVLIIVMAWIFALFDIKPSEGTGLPWDPIRK